MNTADTYDSFLFALALWREARGESLNAKTGVAWVIKNRSTDDKFRWPQTPGRVVLQPLQFSSFNANDPNSSKFPAPTDAAWLECCRVVDAIASATSDTDPTKGANHYHSLPVDKVHMQPDGSSITNRGLPIWAEANKQTAVIGPFHFYRR